jgi:hypothetical protein
MMMMMLTNKKKNVGWVLLAVLWLPVFASVSMLGCSMTDAPQASLAPEQDVRNYYTLVASPGMHYNYAVTSTAPFHPASGTLGMNMQGLADTIGTMPLYSCLWTYQDYGTPTQWFYGLTAQQAVNFGTESSPDKYTDTWVDLQAPLQDSAHWTFTSWGEQITAKIMQYGASATVQGNNYSDVLMVQYTGDSATTGTEWFARGVGLIFSNVTRPHFGMVENQLQSFQK